MTGNDDDKINHDVPDDGMGGHGGHTDPSFDDPGASEEFLDDGTFDTDEDIEAGDGTDNGGDWESYDGDFTDENGEEGEDAASPRKKKLSNVVVIVVALILGVGILMMTVLHNKPAVKQADNAAHKSAPAITAHAPVLAPAVPAAMTAAAKQDQGGLLNNPQALRHLSQTIDKATAAADDHRDATVPSPPSPAPAPAPVAAAHAVPPPLPDVTTPPPGQKMMPAPPPAALLEQKDADILTPLPPPVKAPEKVSARTPEGGALTTPTAEAHLKAESVHAAQPVSSPAKDGFTVAPVMMKAADTGKPTMPNIGADTTPDTALAAKLNQVLDRVSALEEEMTTFEKRPADSGLQAMQQSLAHLSDRLDAIENREKMDREPRHNMKKTVVPSPSHRSVHKVDHVKTPSHSPEKTAVRWVLRAAQPGQAYISRPHQPDMISVHIGDTLPGVGRIEAIDNDTGHWVVRGASGSISQ